MGENMEDGGMREGTPRISRLAPAPAGAETAVRNPGESEDHGV